METFARLCNTNPTTLQRDFQTTFHTSIARYHCEYCLNRARSALKQAQTVYQAAQLAGYDNPECFSKAFKKQFGSNPSEYRMKAV
ncbi:AraC family transcriptional regulator [Neisseria weixii]|uniref:AraC family transcriptional regulator n=1 Tax=Neisseria weixii TaxID=1853276 RepID=A0A3N4MV44_9NEIS|nr:AraC family transcriptional regulator [Neisseria weixii]RPD87635.1 AraC family transcriptional regulator [Neisseria weixii]